MSVMQQILKIRTTAFVGFFFLTSVFFGLMNWYVINKQIQYECRIAELEKVNALDVEYVNKLSDSYSLLNDISAELFDALKKIDAGKDPMPHIKFYKDNIDKFVQLRDEAAQSKEKRKSFIDNEIKCSNVVPVKRN
jgi:cob(I)alamin adenosyltransferase